MDAPDRERLSAEEAAALARLARLARLLDSQFRLPGTSFRFGLDGLLGLLPGVGDAATAVLSAYILAESWRLGVSRGVLAAMLANLAADFVLGSVPLAGDLFDFAFKANLRNLRLLERALKERGGRT